MEKLGFGPDAIQHLNASHPLLNHGLPAPAAPTATAGL